MDSCLDAVFEMISRKAAVGAHLAATVVLWCLILPEFFHLSFGGRKLFRAGIKGV